MVFCAACGIAAVSCYGEQSNSSDIVTDEPENNNQQIHHSSNTARSHGLFMNTMQKKKRVYGYIVKKSV